MSARGSRSRRGTPHVLVLVENLSVPFDRRVYQESKALVEAGYDVTVICPRGTKQDREPEAVVDGIRIHRYPLRAATGGAADYPREYLLALWHTLRLAWKVRRRGRIDVVHACNPPDLLFLVALTLRPWGAKFVFDHHDLVPELFLSRFEGAARRNPLYWVSRVLERLTFACADGVISTNESYRDVAVRRGKVDPSKIVVVRSGPDLDKFVRREPQPSLRRGKEHLLAYLGVMGPQDGVDYALRAVARLRETRDDFHCVFMGGGDALEDMRALSTELGLDDVVEFPGRVPDEFVQECLSTATLCLSPDPKNPLNDVSTMNKVVEYMAMGRPMVSFDLVEARVSAGDAAVYVADDDVDGFAAAASALLDHPERRAEMGRYGRDRVEHDLSWNESRRRLVTFYDGLLGRGARQS